MSSQELGLGRKSWHCMLAVDELTAVTPALTT
jgi:hypothetical protein